MKLFNMKIPCHILNFLLMPIMSLHIKLVTCPLLIQCITNIKFLPNYEYKYIAKLDFDQIRIPNISIPMK